MTSLPQNTSSRARMERVVLAGGFAFGLLAASERVIAQDIPPPEGLAAEEETTGPTISFHGYLTQAYAQASDGQQILGITDDGTADYRTAALQVRADLTEKDTFIIQLSHDRVGESPAAAAFDADVELDWIFYERRFGDSAIKIGRVQIPFGIYNEVRDVGTLFPFFRPSYYFYGEGAYTSETVDGGVLSHQFGPWGSWSLDGDLHFGNWEFIGFDTEFFLNKASNSRGIELWLQTPVPGLRIGAGTMSFNVNDTRRPAGQDVLWTSHHLSVAGQFGRFGVHAEYVNRDFDTGSWEAAYLHLGYRITDKLALNAQIDRAKLQFDGVISVDFADEQTVGVNYAFRPDLVLKAEHHWNEGYLQENPLPNFFGPPTETRHTILSLSTSF